VYKRQISTHDPILALLGDKRVVIKNGGIRKIIETDALERECLDVLQKVDGKLVEIRNMLRAGEAIDFNMERFFVHEIVGR
jgi:hypothetical protein